MNEDQVAERAADASPAFALTSGRQRGYHRAAVDTFLASARRAFETGTDDLGADDVRAASFPLVKGGLRRGRRRCGSRSRGRRFRRARARACWCERKAPRSGSNRREQTRRRSWITWPGLAADASPATGVLTFGYRIDEVDHVSTRIVRYLRDGDPLSAEQLRSAAFRMQRGGYREEQVDAHPRRHDRRHSRRSLSSLMVDSGAFA